MLRYHQAYTAEGQVEIPYTTAEMVDALWSDVHRHMEIAFDSDFRGLCLDLKTNPASSATRLARIADLSAWSMAVWTEYERIKALYLAGDFSANFDPSVLAPRPWTCSQIINS